MRHIEILSESATTTRFIKRILKYARQLPIRIVMEDFPTGGANAVLVTDLFADEPGQGIGTKVMTALSHEADAKGIVLFIMPDTARNRTFYQRFDFSDSNRFPGYMARLPTHPSVSLTESSMIRY